MKKIKVEELGCFQEVASVIGKTRAKLELFRVVEDRPEILNPEYGLWEAFRWNKSPQGHKFWLGIAHEL